MDKVSSGQRGLLPRIVFGLLGLISLVAIGCGTSADPLSATLEAQPPAGTGRSITLGDVDGSDPVKKIKRFGPLADYLAENLGEFGISQGDVVIARSIEEMGRFLSEGTLDIYFDSAYPALAVQESSGSQIIARRWKGGEATIWSTYITLRDNGITKVEDFVGEVLAFEHPESTSGFVLPAGALAQRGFTLREVDQPGAPVAQDEIGYYFSQDEKTRLLSSLAGK